MPCRRLLSLTLCFVFSVFVFSHSASAAVLAIDYGTEWIKASLMKPGVPFDVLLNRDSKRKIQSSVAWKGDDRLFGSDAFNIAARFPTDSFSYLKSLQGIPFDADPVEFYKSISAAEIVRTDRNTVAIRRPDSNSTVWSVEELIAMQFSYVKELAESVGSPDSREAIRDVVLTVPPYYTQFERDAIVDALEIAGLRLLALVNDGTAVALNYAMGRTFPEKEWHVIYDAGAGGIRASVVSLSTVPVDSKSKSTSTSKDSTHIMVAGVGFDRSAGGLELDRRMRDMLARDFERKHGRSITGDKRGMAKLWKEAGRIKTILSANAEAIPSVESVAFDIDYRSKVSRAEFEKECDDLKTRFVQPIKDALANAGLTVNDITSVILAGGHSRVPMVQAAVRSAVGDNKIATSVNADEAAVLGAALYGASVSRQFRTKNFKVVDIVPYDIQISYQSESKLADDGAQKPLKTINTLVFPFSSKTGSKKTLTFKRRDDFSLKMSYRGYLGGGLPNDLSEVNVIGVKEALTNLTEAGAIDPVVKATVMISESGFAGIQDAVAYGEIKDDTFTGKVKSLFGAAGSKDETSSESDSAESTPIAKIDQTDEAETPSGSPTDSASSPDLSPAPELEKKEIKDTIPLKLEIRPLSIPALSPSELRKARDRLIAVDNAEAAKRRREETRNSFEAYLYRLRDLLEDEGTNPFKKCSKEEERKAIQEKLEETLLWMHEYADEAQTIDFWEKKNIIEGLERPIQFRYKEIEAFPSALNNSQRVNWMSRMFITEARANLTAEQANDIPSKWTVDEIDSLEAALKDHEVWLNEWVEKQKSVKPNEDPVILTTEMKARAKTLENSLTKLMRRRLPKVRKTSSSSTTSSTTSSSDSETTSATSAPTEKSSPGPHDEL